MSLVLHAVISACRAAAMAACMSINRSTDPSTTASPLRRVLPRDGTRTVIPIICVEMCHSVSPPEKSADSFIASVRRKSKRVFENDDLLRRSRRYS